MSKQYFIFDKQVDNDEFTKKLRIAEMFGIDHSISVKYIDDTVQWNLEVKIKHTPPNDDSFYNIGLTR